MTRWAWAASRAMISTPASWRNRSALPAAAVGTLISSTMASSTTVAAEMNAEGASTRTAVRSSAPGSPVIIATTAEASTTITWATRCGGIDEDGARILDQVLGSRVRDGSALVVDLREVSYLQSVGVALVLRLLPRACCRLAPPLRRQLFRARPPRRRCGSRLPFFLLMPKGPGNPGPRGLSGPLFPIAPSIPTETTASGGSGPVGPGFQLLVTRAALRESIAPARVSMWVTRSLATASAGRAPAVILEKKSPEVVV